MSLLLLCCCCPVIGYVSFVYLYAKCNIFVSLVLSVVLAYLPTYVFTCYVSKKDGYALKWYQMHPMHNWLKDFIPCSVTLEEKLDHDKQYMFANFPHGTCSINHMLTMTDICGMLSEHHKGERRDLAASVLFYIPVVKELLLFLGCVDASSETCHHNLKKGRSVLIYVGGEKEQLMTAPGQHKIYLQARKGFIKMALQYGCDLVPMYAFGENDLFDTSDAFQGLRNWLQHNFKLGIPIFFDRYGIPFGLLPKFFHLDLEIGKAIPVKKMDKNAITDKDVNELHAIFVKEMHRLFDRTKVKHGLDAKTKLEIL